MTRYVVLERGEGKGADARFLRDRFSLLAFLLPFLWLGARGLYGFAALAFLVQAGLWALGRVESFALASTVLLILFGIAVALEGPRLAAWRLRRRGWREAAVVNAGDRREAELIYYGASETAGLPAQPAPAETPVAQTPPPADAPKPAREALPLLGWRSARTLLDTGRR